MFGGGRTGGGNDEQGKGNSGKAGEILVCCSGLRASAESWWVVSIQ